VPLGLRSFTVISVAIHAAVIGFVAVSSTFKVQSTRQTPSTLTLRTNSKPASASPKPSQKKATKPEVSKPKIVPKLIPVMRPDAPSESPPPTETPPPEDTASSVATSSSANTGDGAASAEGSSGVSLEREAQLVGESLVKPEYTAEALRARVQGLFAVDIHISKEGKVIEIELIQSPGYGMDARIIAALQTAKYFSKRDASGKEMETWITIQFKLEIP